MTIFCNSLNVLKLQTALSPGRVTSYQTLVGGGAVDAGMGAYVWGLELNAAFSPLISMVEVVLRNSLHKAASGHFGKADWYQDVLKSNGDQLWQVKVASDPALSKSYYRKAVPPHNKKIIWVGNQQKHLKHWRSPAEGKLDEIVSRITKSGKSVTSDQVVAHAMFGFWQILFGPSFESPAHPLALWPNCTAAMFSNNPAMTRSGAHAILVRIQDLRNRISHHEPAWRTSVAMTPAGVHSALWPKVQEMRDLLEGMAPDSCKLLENSGAFARLRWLLDPQTVATFAGQAAIPKVNSRALARKVRKLATSASRALNTTPAPNPARAFDVQHAGMTVLTVLPHG